MTMIRFELPTVRATSRRGFTVTDDFRLACLWSALGLAVTGLFFAMGFGADIAQAFMAAG